VFLSREWSVKHKDPNLEKQQLAEEALFFQHFPHRKEILEVFHLAEIEHGRIDYSLHEGQMQVWEINTNPNYYTLSEEPGSDNRQLQQHMEFIDQMAHALGRLQQKCRS
jgi:hypothetical protein